MAVKGSMFQTFGNLIADTVNVAQDVARDDILDEVQSIIVEEFDKFFPKVFKAINNQKFNFKNQWTPQYVNPPALSSGYEVEKALRFNATGPEYFKGRAGLSENSPVVYKKGRKKGQSVYDYKRSLYFTIQQLAKRGNVGETINQLAGGLGVQTKKASGVNQSKGMLVDGKPMKYGARGGLVRATYKEIVSKEFVRLSKLQRAKFQKGYKLSPSKKMVLRPNGRAISLERAIAESRVTLNIQGSFFNKIVEEDKGFLNFLIAKTNLLKIPSGSGNSRDAGKDRIEKILLELHDSGRLLIDPVFGEVLAVIRKRIRKYAKEVSARG